MNTKIFYDNRTFSLGTTGRYFYCTKQGKKYALHRYKYEKEKGKIPNGWHVHHIDGNFLNNEIENLIAIAPLEHRKLHPPSKETMDKWQKAGIKQAPKWHSSNEGREWHRKQYKKLKKKLHALYERKCENCEKKFKSKRKLGAAFCSNACKTMNRYKSGIDDVLRMCNFCKKEFKINKYKLGKFCSAECSSKGRDKSYLTNGKISNIL